LVKIYKKPILWLYCIKKFFDIIKLKIYDTITKLENYDTLTNLGKNIQAVADATAEQVFVKVCKFVKVHKNFLKFG